MNKATGLMRTAARGIRSRRQYRLLLGQFRAATAALSDPLRDSAEREFKRLAARNYLDLGY